MSKWGKRIGLAVIVLLVLLVLLNIYHKPRSSEERQAAAYKEYLQTQDAQSREYMQKAEATLSKAKEINDKGVQNQDSFERLIQRWEKQADRYDALLTRSLSKN
jgi:hypothetical protein